MEWFAFILPAITLMLLIYILFRIKNLSTDNPTKDLLHRLEFIEKSINRLEDSVKDDFRGNREEMNNGLNRFQNSFLETIKDIQTNQLSQLKLMSDQNQLSIHQLTKSLEERLGKLLEQNETAGKENRGELQRNMLIINEQTKAKLDELRQQQNEQNEQSRKQLEFMQQQLDVKLTQLADNLTRNASESRENLEKSLKEFRISFTENVNNFNQLQKEKFAELEKKQAELIVLTEQKLEKMRETVDEKLQKTLEARLGQSFELVSKQLESVQKGLGEMQNLASDVGGLKRVLSNVKTRGIMGEIQLGNILEQIMAPEQYEANVKTKRSGGEFVEFAIKLPGRDDTNQMVYLPIDAKFPQENYHLLQQAYDEANPQKVEEAGKALAASIKKFAKDIRDKYIDPPYTTDFGIMFLPVEGLYAEVVKNTSLVEQLQREFKIIVTGPTTLAAILNSLQMGFKTLAIQKRSSEVWQILGAVKTEFKNFGGILEKARKKIDEAGNEIDSLVGTRTRAIERKLRSVEGLPVAESSLLLDEGSADEAI
jgi:DNA recombination protein RmuC